jgi:hypothetical protein
MRLVNEFDDENVREAFPVAVEERVKNKSLTLQALYRSKRIRDLFFASDVHLANGGVKKSDVFTLSDSIKKKSRAALTFSLSDLLS